MMAYNNEQMRLERDSKVVEAFKRLRLPAMAGLFKEIVDGSITIGEVDVATLLELFIDAGAFVIIWGGRRAGPPISAAPSPPLPTGWTRGPSISATSTCSAS